MASEAQQFWINKPRLLTRDMPVTIKVNGAMNSLVHKGSNHIANSTVPDVCKTPSPGGPVPVPYPVIVSMSSDLANGSTTVTADGGNMIAIKGCELSRCTGDEPGTAGGVKSSTFMKEAKFILYSFDVKIDGQNACRLYDKMSMNHENTVDLAGILGTPVTVLEEDMQKFANECHDEIEKENDKLKAQKKKGMSCQKRGRLKHKCCENALNDEKAKGRHKSARAEYVHPDAPDCRLDVAVVDSKGDVLKIYDYKFNCSGDPKMSAAQENKYIDNFGEDVPITLVGVT